MEKITVLIVDDHTLVRETWSEILNSDPRFTVVAQAGNAEQAIEIAKKTTTKYHCNGYQPAWNEWHRCNT